MKTVAIDMRLSWQIAQLVLLTAIVLLLPGVLHAQTPVNSAMGGYICTIADNFLGNAGRGIATIGISVIGISALIGRITWTQALIVGVGVAVLFGAPTIIMQLGALGICP